MSTRVRAKYERTAKKFVPAPIPIIQGNCIQCAGAGKLGDDCKIGCLENGDLTDNKGRKVKNDLTTSVATCKHCIVVMPDEKTQVLAEWYAKAIDGIVDAADNHMGWHVKTKHFFVLERGCTHHLQVLQWALICGKTFPPGNEAKKCS
jgi:hypothetical protein